MPKWFVKGEALRLLCTNSSKQLLKRTFSNSNHVSLLEVTRNAWWRHFYCTTNSHRGNQCWTKKMKAQRKSCPLWHRITQECQTLKKNKKTSATSGGKTNPSKKDRERAISAQHDELVVSEIRRSPLTPAPAHLTLEGNNQSKISLQNA